MSTASHLHSHWELRFNAYTRSAIAPNAFRDYPLSSRAMDRVGTRIAFVRIPELAEFLK
ncbi:MAG: hypothetical protein ABI240_14985 [Sphingomonas sp.]